MRPSNAVGEVQSRLSEALVCFRPVFRPRCYKVETIAGIGIGFFSAVDVVYSIDWHALPVSCALSSYPLARWVSFHCRVVDTYT
jgi:hypothetical protein